MRISILTFSYLILLELFPVCVCVCVCVCVHARMHTQSCPTLCNPIDCSPPGSSIHGIPQARILEWVVISYSRGSSRPRDRTQVSCISCIGGGFFPTTWEASWKYTFFHTISRLTVSYGLLDGKSLLNRHLLVCWPSFYTCHVSTLWVGCPTCSLLFSQQRAVIPAGSLSEIHSLLSRPATLLSATLTWDRNFSTRSPHQLLVLNHLWFKSRTQLPSLSQGEGTSELKQSLMRRVNQSTL